MPTLTRYHIPYVWWLIGVQLELLSLPWFDAGVEWIEDVLHFPLWVWAIMQQNTNCVCIGELLHLHVWTKHSSMQHAGQLEIGAQAKNYLQSFSEDAGMNQHGKHFCGWSVQWHWPACGCEMTKVWYAVGPSDTKSQNYYFEGGTTRRRIPAWCGADCRECMKNTSKLKLSTKYSPILGESLLVFLSMRLWWWDVPSKMICKCHGDICTIPEEPAQVSPVSVGVSLLSGEDFGSVYLAFPIL